MKKVLLYLWQLPQNILGLVVILFTRAIFNCITYKDYFWAAYKYNFGVSLGNYIILGKRSWSIRTLKHEQGAPEAVIVSWTVVLTYNWLAKYYW